MVLWKDRKCSLAHVTIIYSDIIIINCYRQLSTLKWAYIGVRLSEKYVYYYNYYGSCCSHYTLTVCTLAGTASRWTINLIRTV